METIVVYTAIIGEIDDLLDPVVVNKDVRYVCFSDQPQKSTRVWEVLPAPIDYSDTRRHSRIYKLLAHRYFPDAEYSIWIDGNIEMAIDPIVAMNQWLMDHDLAFYKHPDRDCIYDEAEACIQLGKDHPDLLRQQVHKYRCEGYPEHNGLVASTVILRRHTPSIALLNERWWEEYIFHSRRDQLSFNYVAHILGIQYGQIPGNIFCNEYFRYKSHKRVIP